MSSKEHCQRQLIFSTRRGETYPASGERRRPKRQEGGERCATHGMRVLSSGDQWQIDLFE
jgi:hypothetical protein